MSEGEKGGEGGNQDAAVTETRIVNVEGEISLEERIVGNQVIELGVVANNAGKLVDMFSG
jgi:hypothetical protein